MANGTWSRPVGILPSLLRAVILNDLMAPIAADLKADITINYSSDLRAWQDLNIASLTPI
jgi:hypothetical protein